MLAVVARHALHRPTRHHHSPHYHPPRKEKLKTVLAIVTSYFLLNLPYAVNLLAEYGVQLKTENRQGNRFQIFLTKFSPELGFNNREGLNQQVFSKSMYFQDILVNLTQCQEAP